MKRFLLSSTLLALLVGLGGLAHAQDKGVSIGTLRCDEASGSGFIFSSSKDLKCVFSPAGKDAKSARYTGKINRYGVDIGFTENAVVLWGVVSTSNKFTPGDLAGKYVGATAQAAWAVGLGANVLLGGSNNGFALQPLSVQGFNGMNLAAGLLEVELKASN